MNSSTPDTEYCNDVGPIERMIHGFRERTFRNVDYNTACQYVHLQTLPKGRSMHFILPKATTVFSVQHTVGKSSPSRGCRCLLKSRCNTVVLVLRAHRMGCARTFGPGLRKYIQSVYNVAQIDFHEVVPACDVPFQTKTTVEDFGG